MQLVPRLPPRPGAEPPPRLRHHDHGLGAEGRPGRPGAGAHEGQRRPHPRELHDMPPLGHGSRLPIYGQPDAPGGVGADGRRPWRSLEERTTRALPSPEFPEGAAEAPEGVGRRDFMAIMGASAALAGLACRPPRHKLLPYAAPAGEGARPGHAHPLRHRLHPERLRHRPPRHLLRRAAHQGGGEPRPPRQPGRRRQPASWPRCSTSTTRAGRAASGAARRRSPPAASSASWRRSRRATPPTAAPASASSPAPPARPCSSPCGSACWSASPGRASTPGRASPTTRCARAPASPSASPSSRGTSSTGRGSSCPSTPTSSPTGPRRWRSPGRSPRGATPARSRTGSTWPRRR